MDHHDHDHIRRWWPLHSRTALACVVTVAVIMVGTLVALFALWPGGSSAQGQTPTPRTEKATVVQVEPGACRAAGGDPSCRRVTVKIDTGRATGSHVGMDLGSGFAISPGDGVLVNDNDLPPEATVGGAAADPFSFADFQRTGGLLWLTIIFAVLVLVATRWQGLRALVALGFSLLVVIYFVLPALGEGTHPVAVALVGGLAITLVAFPLSHGIGPKTISAILGTVGALVVALVLGELATRGAHITGFASDEASYLTSIFGDLSIRGLVLAGLVIGALGVLDDLAVTQASAVMALRRVSPDLGTKRLFQEALSVGRDHIVAVINTLTLAYVGASLPVLMIFAAHGVGVGDAINSEAVAAEIVATLVGSIGLIVAVPLTTAIAAVLAVRVPEDAVKDAHHHHAH